MHTHTHRLTRAVVALLAILLAVPVMAHQINAKDLEIKHPSTIESSSPTVQDAAVYMVIRNKGPITDMLIAARSPFATSVSIETQKTTQPKSRADSVEIPAHAETVVGPKTTYLQLHGLTEPLEGYQYIPLTLVFEHTGVVEIEVYVEGASEIQPTAPKMK